MPVVGLTLKHSLRYRQRIVGMQRYYTARQSNIEVKHVLRCPLLPDVTTQDIAIPNDVRQYKIDFIQYPEDVDPPVMDLTLVDVTAVYAIS